MKRPSNRMAVVETPEPERVEPNRVVRSSQKQCPMCGKVGAVISELMRRNRIFRERRCEKCFTRWTEEE